MRCSKWVLLVSALGVSAPACEPSVMQSPHDAAPGHAGADSGVTTPPPTQVGDGAADGAAGHVGGGLGDAGGFVDAREAGVGDADASATDGGAATSIESAPLSDATKRWWAYDRPAGFDVAKSNVMVPMRDSVTLACTLCRPAKGAEPAPGKFPGLVVEYTPYALIGDIMIAEAAFFAKHGYNALVCQVRGTGLSGGTWNHAGARQDGLDAYDQIEWLATQGFSDGRMGQFGGSYGGFTSYQAAAEQPPHLLATAPMIPPGSLYHDVIYPGGIKTTERGTIDAWPVTAEIFSLLRINADAEYAMNRSHPTFDAYWQERSMYGRIDAIKVPILTIGAWDDPNFRSGTLDDIEAGLDKTWAIYGQWPHRSPVALETKCDSCVPEPLPSGVLLAWFDHWVHQLPDVPLPKKPLFISEEGPRGVGQGWRELSWNRDPASVPSYQLGSDNTLSLKASATGVTALHQPAEPKDVGGSASFTTAPLGEDHVLTGHSALHLRAVLSAADANFYVELLEVNTKGEEVLVNDGFLKASHRTSHAMPEPVTPGAAIDYVIAIRADHYRFVAGNSLRIRISGGDSKSLVPAAVPVDVMIQTGAASTLHLPPGW